MREQFGRLFRGEFKEFFEAGLDNLENTNSDLYGMALMFSGGIKYEGVNSYPQINIKGILQWKNRLTGRFTKAPIKLP